jgi:hypothetical protein
MAENEAQKATKEPMWLWELLGFAWVVGKCSLTRVCLNFIDVLGKLPISIMIMSDRIHTLIGFKQE